MLKRKKTRAVDLTTEEAVKRLFPKPVIQQLRATASQQKKRSAPPSHKKSSR